MRLTAFCVCGTLLAFSSLSRIRAEEGVLLGDRGFGPCVATLRPAGECRPGEHDSMCPYHIVLPPLVVDLPQHLLELENIMLDLQKLKDSVDELREMCADCTGGQTGRKYERKSGEELSGGKSTHEDVRDWMNERPKENDTELERGKNCVKVETMVGDNNMKKKLKDGNEPETGGVVKENEREEPVTQGAIGEGALVDLKVPTSGGNMETVNVTREKNTQTNPKGSKSKFQDDMLEESKEITKEQSGHHMWRDKTKKMEKITKAETSDGIKMSTNHTVNINKVEGQTEMEKGIKVDPNKKKPKQMESFGLKEKSREIKTESEQRDGDGETSSSKTTERTDFLSITPTPLTTGLTSWPDSSDTKSFASSLPSPSLLSSTLSSIADVIPDPKAGYGLTESREPGAAGVTEVQSQTEAWLSTTTETTSSVEQITNDAVAGLAYTTPSATTPLQSSFITLSTTVIDHRHWVPKKNIGSKSKTVLKRPSVQASKPGEKQKSGFKPEAEKRRKNAKNDHKPNQGPSTEGKTKLNQKQKPHKPTGVKSKLGKDSKQIQDEKYGQRTTPDISTTAKNQKSKLMHKQEVAVNKPKSKQNSETSFQRPQDVNTTDPAKYTLINRQYDNVSDPHQKLKLEKKLVQPLITKHSNQKSNVRLNSEEKLNDTFELRQNPESNPINYLMTKYIRKITTFNLEHSSEYESTPVPNQKPFNESVSKFEENIENEMTKSPHLTPGQNSIADRPNTSSDNMNDSQPSQEFENKTTTPLTESAGNSEENSLQEPNYNPDLPPGETFLLAKATVCTDQKNNSSQDRLKTKNKQESTKQSSSESIKRETSTKTPKQTLLIEPINKSNANHSHDAKLNPDVTPGWTSAPDQPRVTDHLMNKSSQGIHTTKHKPNSINPKSEMNETTASPKPNRMLSTLFGNKAEENPLRKTKNQNLTAGQKVIYDQANTTLDYINKSSQEDHKHKNKPETNREHTSDKANKSEENFLQELILNPHLTPGLDQAMKNPDQKTKSREDYFKDTQNPKDIDSFKSNKSETSNTEPSAKLIDISEETSWQEPTPNPGLRPGHRFTPDQGSTNPDQIKKFKENYFKDKPENIQKLNKSERATPKPNQRLLPESVDQSGDFQEPTSYPDLTPGQTTKPNQVTTSPDHKNKTNRKHPKSQTSQEFKFSKSETVTQKPSVESRDKFQEKSLQKATSNPGLPQTSTIDLHTATTYQPTKFSQDHSNTKHNRDKFHDFTSNKSITIPKPNQHFLPKSVDKSEEKKQTKSFLDLTHGQTSISDQTTTKPDQVNTVHDKHLKTQASKDFKFTKSETASPKTSTESWNKSEEISLQGPTPDPGLTSGHISTMDLATTVTDQIKKSTDSYLQTEPYDTKFNKGEAARSKPQTDSWHKSKEAHLQQTMSNPGLAHGEASTSDLDTAAVDRINKFIHNHHGAQQNPENIEDFQSNESKTTNKKPSPEPKGEEHQHKNRSESESVPARDQAKTLPAHRSKPNHNVPKLNRTPEPGPEPRHNQKNLKITPNLKTRPNANINQTQQTNLRPKTPRPDLKPNLKPKPVPEKSLNATYNRTPKERPPFRHKPSMRPTVKQGIKPIQRPKQAAEPEPSPQTKTDPPQIRWVPSGNIQNSRTDMPPTSGLVKQIAEVSHTPGETEFSTSVRKTITLRPKTYNSLENGYFPAIHTHPEDVTLSPNSRITSDPRPQTAGLPSSVPMTTRPNNTNCGILQNVITSTAPGTTKPTTAPISEAKTLHEEESPPASPVPSPKLETTSRLSLDFRPKTSSTSGPEPPPAELSTPSPRELRVKINQVTAFVNSSMIPNRRPEELPKEQPKGSQRGGGSEKTDGKLPTSTAFTAVRDCSDHLLRGRTRSGVYLVTPDMRSSSFQVFCDMELDGGGWTVLQRRQDGSVSFNRSWVEYQAGFGVLAGGEFWLGNSKMHLLTRDRDMVLRVELEDFDGVAEHAQYEHFRVASERLRYRLTVGVYSGTAGDALRFSKTYDHHNRAFTTPDRDNDRYPSGNCGAYYSSGWWFDACMAANLNGRYYLGKYRGVRDGIFWGTWHNISTEYYPTNERQSFKSVRMMIRPKRFGVR